MSSVVPASPLTAEQFYMMQQYLAFMQQQQTLRTQLSTPAYAGTSECVPDCVSECASECVSESALASASASSSTESSKIPEGHKYWMENVAGFKFVHPDGVPVNVVCKAEILPILRENINFGIKSLLVTVSQMATLHDKRTYIQTYNKPLEEIQAPIIHLSTKYEGRQISLVFWSSPKSLLTGVIDKIGKSVSVRRVNVYSTCGVVLPSRVVYQALVDALTA